MSWTLRIFITLQIHVNAMYSGGEKYFMFNVCTGQDDCMFGTITHLFNLGLIISEQPELS